MSSLSSPSSFRREFPSSFCKKHREVRGQRGHDLNVTLGGGDSIGAERWGQHGVQG